MSKDNMLVVSNQRSSESTDPAALRITFESEIRPILNALEELRKQSITEENVNIPSIVVIGDQSSGKSSVLESLAGIMLPQGQGIVTRVPLVLRLQSCLEEEDSLITMEYEGTERFIIDSEEGIEAAILTATDNLAGSEKGIRNTPVYLHIRKPSAPDLTMVDLPGITRIPVCGQPEDIYEQIRDMILHYIRPEESIILNVLSAEVDFPTCESIRLSQMVDKEGVRTLAVVTKVDKSPDGVFEKVTKNAVNIGLGYVCVRNRIADDKNIADSRRRESKLFKYHPDLRKLDPSMVGIPNLARKLVKIQANMVRGCLPRIQDQIHLALLKRREEMNKFPKCITTAHDAYTSFLSLQQNFLSMLTQIVKHGDFQMVPDDDSLHYFARLNEEFTHFYQDLRESIKMQENDPSRLQQIRSMVLEHRVVNLAKFLPVTVMFQLVKQELDRIGPKCCTLVDKVFAYSTKFVLRMNNLNYSSYPYLRDWSRSLTVELLEKTRVATRRFVERMLAKESSIIFTAGNLDQIEMDVKIENDATDVGNLYGEEVEVEGDNASGERAMWNAFLSYMNIVHARLADGIALEIRYALQDAIVNRLYELAMLQVMTSPERLMSLIQQDPEIVGRCEYLQERIDALEKSTGLLTLMIGR